MTTDRGVHRPDFMFTLRITSKCLSVSGWPRSSSELRSGLLERALFDVPVRFALGVLVYFGRAIVDR